MALLLSQHKMIDWLTKQISKRESLDSNNNSKEVKKAKQQVEEQELGRENTKDYIRKNDGRIHILMTINGDCTIFYEFAS